MSDVFFTLWDDEVLWDDAAVWDENGTRASLLPQNTTELERAFEQTSARVADVPVPLRPLWDADDCPDALLPWLAWSLSVDDWSSDWAIGTQREVIRQSVNVHRRKGTIGAIRRALIAAGYGDATVIERAGGASYGGASLHDGSVDHGPGDHWAEYRVTMARPITNEQALMVRAILASVAPLRCHLKVLDYSEVAFLHNAAVSYDGAVNYGAA